MSAVIQTQAQANAYWAGKEVKKWTAMCRHCGPVSIVQKTKPKSCKTAIAVNEFITRRCGYPLECVEHLKGGAA